MKLLIISPSGESNLEIAWLELNTAVGNFVIQPGHAPMIVTLAPNKQVTFCLKSGKQESFIVKQGIADIMRTEATLFLSDTF
ncbi:MAG: hypothetical protein NTX86_06305 [Candidatus Dependentiae bacterium]|nr:hypothetical protein [Candidatus Dependentiae bacterium]